jgi:bifunctional non-homologous end joining protein LigD
VKPSAGPDWVHEIKHDGSGCRSSATVIPFGCSPVAATTGAAGPAIVVTAMQLRATSFTLDGEAVVCGPDGIAIFDALHRRGAVSEAMLYAFDLLEVDGEDLRVGHSAACDGV